MSTALISGEVLTRRTNSFKSRQTGEDVTYHEAIVFDPVAKTFTVVRSSSKGDLMPFEPGTSVVEVPGTFREQTNIPASLVRPGDAVATSAGSDW